MKTKKPFVVTIMSPRSRVKSENACAEARRACSSTVGQTGFGDLELRSKASRRTRQRSDATCCCQICGVHSVEIGLSPTGSSCNDDLATATEPAGVAVCTRARTAVTATIATTAQTFKRSLTSVSLAIARIKFDSDEAGNSGTDYRQRTLDVQEVAPVMAQRRRRSLRRALTPTFRNQGPGQCVSPRVRDCHFQNANPSATRKHKVRCNSLYDLSAERPHQKKSPVATVGVVRIATQGN